MPHLLWPVLAVTALWFVGTGLVAMLNHRLASPSAVLALAAATACALGGVALLVGSSHMLTPLGAFASFLGGLLVWSWHEISFLTGAVAGSHRNACRAELQGWPRFWQATSALIHHELALAVTAVLLLALAFATGNSTGAFAFGLLFLFRLSSKLNLFVGVPNFSDELFPQHMAYLKSYFGPRRLHPLLPLSIAVIAGAALWFAHGAVTQPVPYLAVQSGMLSGLALLAAVEHLFLVVPFRDSALWGWATGAITRR